MSLIVKLASSDKLYNMDIKTWIKPFYPLRGEEVIFYTCAYDVNCSVT